MTLTITHIDTNTTENKGMKTTAQGKIGLKLITQLFM